jgi:hypothetical protein
MQIIQQFLELKRFENKLSNYIYTFIFIMSYSGGLTINYTGARVEDVILNKANIDSDKDVLAASYSLEQMQEIKTELLAAIATLQTQVNEQAILIQQLQDFVIALQGGA